MTSRFKTLAIGLVAGFLMGAVATAGAQAIGPFMFYSASDVLRFDQSAQLAYIAGVFDMLDMMNTLVDVNPQAHQIIHRQTACLERREKAAFLGGLMVWAQAMWLRTPSAPSAAFILFDNACTGLD
jgi:hypothetical protein